MKDYLKNELKHLPMVLLICAMFYGITTFATNYVFTSSDVRFDNTGTSLDSVNVQDAIDETFRHLTDYNNMDTRVTNVETTFLDKTYPVGSIYISVENTNPQTLFGGTWQVFGTGKTLVGVDTNDADYDTVEESHGAKTVTLETANLPSHSHYYTPSGTNSGTAVTAHTYTPAGSVSQPTFTGTAVTSGANSRGHTHSYNAPANHTHGTSNLTAGLNMFTAGSRLYIDYATRSGTAYSENRRAFVGSGDLSEAVHSETNSVGIAILGNTNSGGASSSATSGGESQNHTHSVTAAGTVSKPTFTGTQATLSHTVTQPTFTGTRTTTETTGSGTAFSTVDPYITVYMWKRTA